MSDTTTVERDLLDRVGVWISRFANPKDQREAVLQGVLIDVDATIEQQARTIAEQAARLERADETFHRISDWARAYPLDVFPEPDFKRVHEVLSVAGLSLDQVSASNMRHVITQVQGMVDAAIDGAKT